MALVLSGCGGLSEAEEHYNAGVELQEQGRLEEAIAEYDEAIRLDPQDAVVYYNRGFAYDDLGQHQRAIQDYDEAIPASILNMPTPTTTEVLRTTTSASTKGSSRITMRPSVLTPSLLQRTTTGEMPMTR